MGTTKKSQCNSTPNAVVVGLGKNSNACAAYLIDQGWDVEMLDVKPHPQLERLTESELPGIMIHTELGDHVFMNVDLVVMCRTTAGPYAEVLELAAQYGCRIVTSLELFFERSQTPTAAIIGSNGKSTVLALVQEIAKRKGRVACIDAKNGYPFLALLDDHQPDIYILELTAQQLAQMRSASPDIIAILNHATDQVQGNAGTPCSDDMDRVAADAELMIINRDDARVSGITGSGTRIEFGRSEPAADSDFGIMTHKSARWIVKGAQRLIRLDDCALRGNHNELNILAACAIADAAGFAIPAARQAILTFKGLPYSCEDEGKKNGIRWVNDSRSTNVDAAIAAIECSDEPVVLIAGGLSQGDDFSKITQKVNGKLRGCVLFGRDSWQIGESFNGIKNKELVEDIDDAIAVAERIASEGDRVVFSPACVSHDMFSDYEQRGESFSQALRSHFDDSGPDTN